MTDLERRTRAAYEKFCEQEAKVGNSQPAFPDLPAEQQDRWREIVRAAMEAR